MTSTPVLTDELRQEAMRAIKESFDVAATYIDRGRSSMPMHIEDVLLLAGLAAHGLDTLTAPNRLERVLALADQLDHAPGEEFRQLAKRIRTAAGRRA